MTTAIGRALLFAFLTLLVPTQAWAQTIELTLNCQYESSYQQGRESPTSGAFSAIVRMSHVDDAMIEATTPGCFNYVGYFTNLEVIGNCERTAAGVKTIAFLAIDRISGAFELGLGIGDRGYINSHGRCTQAKKLF